MQIIRASAPGRCSIVGNPSDGYGGTVISCTLEERAQAQICEWEFLKIVANDQELVPRVPSDFELHGDFFDIPKAVLQHFQLTAARIELRIGSTIPYRAGMSGSSALYAAVYGAVATYIGLEQSRYEIAEAIHDIEAKVMAIQCGYQDHYMDVFGGINYMDFAGKECMRKAEEATYAAVEPLALYVEHLPFIIATTGIQRVSGTILKPVRERWESGEELVVNGYRRAAELARMGKRMLMKSDWRGLGGLMNENHSIQQAIGVSGAMNDQLIEAARAAGAEGAKLAGAGGGGTIIALATNSEPVIRALIGAGATRILYPKVSPGLEVHII